MGKIEVMVRKVGNDVEDQPRTIEPRLTITQTEAHTHGTLRRGRNLKSQPSRTTRFYPVHNPIPTPLTRLWLALLVAMPVVPTTLAAADDGPLPVTIYARQAPSYERKLDANGRPEREYYAIGYGGRLDGTVWDLDQTKENFPEIAGIIAKELARQNYFFSENSADTDLLIVLHWGRTNPSGSGNFSDNVGIAGHAYREVQDAQNAIDNPSTAPAVGSGGTSVSVVGENQLRMQEALARLDSAITAMRLEERQRNYVDEDNAKVLGYTDEMHRGNDIAQHAGSDSFLALLNELRQPRYYVVVTAYDFNDVTKLKNARAKPKPQWVTRFSIRTRGNQFMPSIEEMALRAGQYFGRNSKRLIRDHRGDVEIGEIQMIENDVEAAPND